LGFVFEQVYFAHVLPTLGTGTSKIRGLLLEQKHRAKMRGWMGAGCALGLICALSTPRITLAQAPAPGTAAPAAQPHPATNPTVGTPAKSNSASQPGKSKYAASHRNRKKKTTARGQQKIDPARAQEIQEALIREHYLSGQAAGTWNQSSEEAMRRYQADHGWQSKTVPDSRALIALGLGPSHDHLLNPESAMTTGPFPTRASSSNSDSATPVSHSADPGARMNTNPNPPAAPAPATAPVHDSSGPQ
jgi:hypothetical protein